VRLVCHQQRLLQWHNCWNQRRQRSINLQVRFPHRMGEQHGDMRVPPCKLLVHRLCIVCRFTRLRLVCRLRSVLYRRSKRLARFHRARCMPDWQPHAVAVEPKPMLCHTCQLLGPCRLLELCYRQPVRLVCCQLCLLRR